MNLLLCNLCQSKNSTKILDLEKYKTAFWICDECGLVYLNPQPSDDDLVKYYQQDYADFSDHGTIFEKIREGLRRKRAKALKKLVPSGHILDIGCEQGKFLETLKKEGNWEVSGVEISDWAAEKARKKGLNVKTGAFLDVDFENESFDLIMSLHVIEHVRDAVADVTRMYNLLRKGGYLILSTPNYDSFERQVSGRFWYGWQIPYHMFIFSPKSIQRLLKEAGFTIKKIDYSWIPNDWAGSFGNVVGSQKWGVYNPGVLGIFSPLGLVSGIMKKSGRFTVIAQKT